MPKRRNNSGEGVSLFPFMSTVMAERDAESKKTQTIQEEIAKLEGLLDKTPVLATNKPTVVNIPNSRPIPDNAKMFYAIARKGRVHNVDPNAALKIFNGELAKHRNDWLYKRVQRKGAPDRYIYDGQKIAAFFKNYNWGNTRNQKIEIIAKPTAHRLQLVITPDLEKGGTPTENLATPGSPYSEAAATILKDFKAVLMFQVATDSFNTYLEARQLADKANIAAGWELKSEQRVIQRIEEPEIRCLEPAPPRPPGQPDPVKPPPLKPKLD